MGHPVPIHGGHVAATVEAEHRERLFAALVVLLGKPPRKAAL
jgi:hypothetical protein